MYSGAGAPWGTVNAVSGGAYIIGWDITGCAAAAEPPVVVIGAASMYCGAAV